MTALRKFRYRKFIRLGFEVINLTRMLWHSGRYKRCTLLAVSAFVKLKSGKDDILREQWSELFFRSQVSWPNKGLIFFGANCRKGCDGVISVACLIFYVLIFIRRRCYPTGENFIFVGFCSHYCTRNCLSLRFY